MPSRKSDVPEPLAEVRPAESVGIHAELPFAPILEAVREDLTTRGSKLVHEGELDLVFVEHAHAILVESMSAVLDESYAFPSPSVDYDEKQNLQLTGEIRAQQGLHPAESLMAAEILFDHALPALVSYSEARNGADAITVSVARALHHAIWRRFPPGAIAYAETLRQRLFAADFEVRRRVSRELHDRVAHAISAGMNRIDVSRFGNALEAQTHLDVARQVLSEALRDVQDIAVELRQLVGDRPLTDVIRDYSSDISDLSPAIELKSSGVAVDLPSSVSEEVFTVVREALRNARTHAHHSGKIRLSLAWEAECVTIVIEDSGPGFNFDEISTESIGLRDMHERAAAIGGQLQVDSDPMKGTRVRLTAPTFGSTAYG
ncbi:hypothetical protein ESZ53_04400 [Salinibacterium sp. UTAS2018]|uniref:sensor histidine kinase n=1 Tax=Salinibacterium sp. UTAS2018 TaxID=2508880 RepID=UPI00100979AC|nr:ATP-binding protein [Salinibacterium sp. UTAS2018]QAV69740.1 hypothetical protein ESZ53_04400 [Salinibacterium sp. UTAS2018]